MQSAFSSIQLHSPHNNPWGWKLIVPSQGAKPQGSEVDRASPKLHSKAGMELDWNPCLRQAGFCRRVALVGDASRKNEHLRWDSRRCTELLQSRIKNEHQDHESQAH